MTVAGAVAPPPRPGPGRPPGVLVTRPEPGSAETAARLAALGWEPVLAPALLLRPRAFAMPPAQALLLTSRAAARALPPPPPGLRAFAVGEATAAELRRQGWPDVSAASGTAEDLARQVAGRLDPQAGPLLLAVGEGYALDLAAELRRRGFRVIRRVAYAAEPARTLPDAAAAALREGRVGTVLFHSPRSALSAISLLRGAGLLGAAAQAEVLAISRRVAEAAARALAPLTWRSVRVAARPEESALLDLLGPRAQPVAEAAASASGEP